jgi:hypothetical protein
MKDRIRHPSNAAVWAIIVATALAVSNAAGQSNPRSPQPGQRMDSPEYGNSTERDPEWERQKLLWRMGRLKDSPRTERLDAQVFDREFTERLAEFATAWNQLMRIVDKGAWNLKQARKTRKAFERLVHSQGWVEKSKD